MKALQIMLLGLLLSSAAFADNDEDSDSDGHGPCGHPVFVTHDCLDSLDLEGTPGTDGQDGANGTNGVAGTNGTDGTNGINGVNGLDGVDGKAGVDGKDGHNGLDGIVPNYWYRSMRDYLAATSAAQVYLPRDKGHRMTLGMSHIGSTGIGVGIAGMDSEGVAYTLSLGHAGSETVVNGSVSWEF